ncbi:hypothetical protein KC968_01560 [Candidatus Saccharibacteria bacterium]|nr:hypothetical protein [Candidatus Saccharibacteria bacterium]
MYGHTSEQERFPISRPGHGEPVDLYESDEFASDLEDWTARIAQDMDRRAAERRSMSGLPEELSGEDAYTGIPIE